VWDGARIGAALTLIWLPVEATFCYGFDLPISKAMGLVRVILLALGWWAL
jgi:hypothetical protein